MQMKETLPYADTELPLDEEKLKEDWIKTDLNIKYHTAVKKTMRDAIVDRIETSAEKFKYFKWNGKQLRFDEEAREV